MNNTYTVKLNDGREVCYSYAVPVACHIPGRGYIRSKEHHSVTTSKHANAYAGRDSEQVEPGEFAALIAPLVAR